MRNHWTAACASAALFCAATARAAVPAAFSHHGRLLDGAENPVTATLTLTVRFYSRPVDASEAERLQNLLAERTYANVRVTGGVYSLLIGDPDLGEPLDPAVFAGTDRWMAIRIGDDSEMAPRLRVASVPWALRAGDADSLGSLAPAAFAKWSDLPWDKSDAQKTFAGAVAGALAGATVTGDLTLAGTGKLGAQEVAAESVCIGADCRSDWPAASVWTAGSGGISYSGGNVGIGKASATEALDVAGNVKGTGVCIGEDCRGAWPAATQWTGGSGGALSYSGGNVGIGTASPGEKLEVAGNVKGTGLCIGGDCKSAWPASSPWATGSGGALSYSGGNVGIGTASPGEKLEVAGNVKGTGLCIGGDCKSAWPASSPWAAGSGGAISYSGGGVGIGTAAPKASLDLGNQTDGVILPRGTTLQRPGAPEVGQLRYNTTLGYPEYYDGFNWIGLRRNLTATGGTVVESGGYRIHTFTSNGTFTPNFVGNVEVLVVAGGGGGGGRSGGGGGAGGLLYSAAYAVSPQAYPVTVGGGGAGGPGDGTPGANGSNSVFGSLTAIGGGVGASDNVQTGADGGSGGGGKYGSAGGSGTSGQGNRGGSGYSNPYAGGGGGGAGGVGVDGTSGGEIGDGGPGLAYSISGSSAYYAGGGGGGAHNPANGLGYGGIGGGGNGGAPGGKNNGAPGAANTGGGGGAGSTDSGNGGAGGNGGSGIVIVRYPL